jgi:hypothetical protein
MTSTVFGVVSRDHVLGFLFAMHGRSVPRVAERQNGPSLRRTTLGYAAELRCLDNRALG